MPRCFQFQNAPFLFSSYSGFLAHFISVFVSLYIRDSPHKKVISSTVTLTLSSLTKGVINYTFEIIFARISCEVVYYICELYFYAMIYSEC